MKPRGYECVTCGAFRLHRILTAHDGRSQRSRLYRLRECTVCCTRTPLSLHEQPGVACPKCLEIRCLVDTSKAEFRVRKVIDGEFHALHNIPVRRRWRKCQNPKCGHNYRTLEMNEANFC